MHDAVLERALLPDHDALAMFLLQQRDINRFGKKLIEVQVGGSGTPIAVEHSDVGANNGSVHILLPDNGRDSGNPNIVREPASKFAGMMRAIEHAVIDAAVVQPEASSKCFEDAAGKNAKAVDGSDDKADEAA